MTTIAGSWMKAVDAPLASTSTAVDPQAETLRLFQEHGTALFRFCRSVLRDTGDAEDVVQETFLKLLNHLQHGGDTPQSEIVAVHRRGQRVPRSDAVARALAAVEGGA